MTTAPETKQGSPDTAKTAWAWTIGTFFGIGLIGPGPGTWASLVAAGIWYFAARAAHAGTTGLMLATAFAALGVTLVGIPAASVVERESGREDPGHVVIDEVSGQWFALAACPVDIGHAVLAFALFRLFDIVKPWPARRLERLHGGLGIMMDDVAAGIYALVTGLVVHHWW
jgi:phosphatidylglycerophosphatase A